MDFLDLNDPKIKQEIIHLVSQYLEEQGFSTASRVLNDENLLVNYKINNKRLIYNSLKEKVSEGEWKSVEELTSTNNDLKKDKHLMFEIYKQQFLELIEERATSKAFEILTKKLKPLEYSITHNHSNKHSEFKELCYLITAKSVSESALFKDWKNVNCSREQLTKQIEILSNKQSAEVELARSVPPNRLENLLKQAILYQLDKAKVKGLENNVLAETLITDYCSPILPNKLYGELKGHSANIKCLKEIDNLYLASGSSDNNINIWDVHKKEHIQLLKGHTSRIWDLDYDPRSKTLFSASGDKNIKTWSVSDDCISYVSTISENQRDVYSVNCAPHKNNIVCGGYDKIIRIVDTNTNSCINNLGKHKSSITKVLYNLTGNIVTSGSKDKTVKLWDVSSGTMIHEIHHLSEISFIDMDPSGTLLLTASKDNSNRIWDVRKLSKCMFRLSGHQNSTKNHIRSRFITNNIIASGSEDGRLYLYDKNTTKILDKLQGSAGGTVYDISHFKNPNVFASATENGIIELWHNK